MNTLIKITATSIPLTTTQIISCKRFPLEDSVQSNTLYPPHQLLHRIASQFEICNSLEPTTEHFLSSFLVRVREGVLLAL